MTAETLHRQDRDWMEQCLALAALAEGTTSPNPRVGSIVVRDGVCVGSGHHEAAGGPHAETRALAQAGAAASGATLYVNLEPCAHHGRTPPCCERIVRSGIRRVVAAVVDPNPLVDGKGFECLRQAGLEVTVGVLEGPARRLNAAFFHWHETGRPRVTIKAASTLDGLLSAAGGQSRWITGPEARRFAHRLRLRHDAVLVGARTVRRDDPQLTIRLAGLTASPLRVVIAPGGDLPARARVFVGGDARVYVRDDPPVSPTFQAERTTVVGVPCRDGRMDLAAVLDDLGAAGVQSLLVEGGGRTIAGFLQAGLADEAALFVAPKLLGARGATPLLDIEVERSPETGWRLEIDQQLRLGDDRALLGRLRAVVG